METRKLREKGVIDNGQCITQQIAQAEAEAFPKPNALPYKQRSAAVRYINKSPTANRLQEL